MGRIILTPAMPVVLCLSGCGNHLGENQLEEGRRRTIFAAATGTKED